MVRLSPCEVLLQGRGATTSTGRTRLRGRTAAGWCVLPSLVSGIQLLTSETSTGLTLSEDAGGQEDSSSDRQRFEFMVSATELLQKQPAATPAAGGSTSGAAVPTGASSAGSSTPGSAAPAAAAAAATPTSTAENVITARVEEVFREELVKVSPKQAKPPVVKAEVTKRPYDEGYAISVSVGGKNALVNGSSARFQAPEFARKITAALHALNVVPGDMVTSPVQVSDKTFVIPAKAKAAATAQKSYVKTCGADFSKQCPEFSQELDGKTKCLGTSKCTEQQCCSKPKRLTNDWCSQAKVLKLWGNYTIMGASDMSVSEKLGLCESGKVEKLLNSAAMKLLATTSVGKRIDIDLGVGPNFCDGEFISVPVFFGGLDSDSQYRELEAILTPESLLQQVMTLQLQEEKPLELKASSVTGLVRQRTSYSFYNAKQLQNGPQVNVFEDWYLPLTHNCTGGCPVSGFGQDAGESTLPSLPVSLWASQGVLGATGGGGAALGSVVGTWFIQTCYQYTDVTCGNEERLAYYLKKNLEQSLLCQLGYNVRIETGIAGAYNENATPQMKMNGCARVPDAATQTQRYIDMRITQYKPSDEGLILDKLKDEEFKYQVSDDVFSVYNCQNNCMNAAGLAGPDGKCHQNAYYWAPNGGEPRTQIWNPP
ncbi:unnamed protein product [Amoebophrya sp. A120]|nr:unnamed protein product [Amoebophrya sp. A120]|eukprot:GSA120T00016472001.1